MILTATQPDAAGTLHRPTQMYDLEKEVKATPQVLPADHQQRSLFDIRSGFEIIIPPSDYEIAASFGYSIYSNEIERKIEAVASLTLTSVWHTHGHAPTCLLSTLSKGLSSDRAGHEQLNYRRTETVPNNYVQALRCLFRCLFAWNGNGKPTAEDTAVEADVQLEMFQSIPSRWILSLQETKCQDGETGFI